MSPTRVPSGQVTPSRRLSRTEPAPPVRIVHLGLGAFFRAHLAWYTQGASDAGQWGIAAFTGRSDAAARVLAAQDGLYTLLTRGADGDTAEIVRSLAAVHASTDHEAFLGYLRDPAVAVVSLTVTEAGYCLGAGGGLALAREDVRADVRALRTDPTAPVTTIPARVLAGVLARHEAGLPPVAVMSCDNLPDNGAVIARVVRDLAAEVSPALPAVVDRVEFVSTMVDRITPRATEGDRESVAATIGWRDDAPVVTEPFSEWVLHGDFASDRPRWETSGARFVADLRPFEQRKLWLLNGAHSMLAYAGGVRGHRTVAEAVADPRCLREVEQWWDQVEPHLAFGREEVAAYRSALRGRFANPRIRHELAQIAVDGSVKLPLRVLPVLRAEREAARGPGAVAPLLAAWVLHLRGAGPPVVDVHAEELARLVSGPLEATVRGVLARWGPDLAADDTLVRATLDAAAGLTP
ncbi:mannitol dehydrogenase family protein [Oryzihumus sp.]|uniref:mannitol dehydrogenase family protein n=1 Tax=Oryzihumus sp. TaxID=1968903 RepID=UPI002EDAACDD